MTLRALFLALLVGWMPAAFAALPAALADGNQLPSLAPMIEGVSPAVVNIATFTNVQQYTNPLFNDPFFRRFFNVPDNVPGNGPGPEGKSQRRTRSAGSGVIVDAKNGYILTNAHVVDGASEIEVGLVDGRTLKAELVGADRHVDVAVLKVVPDALTEIHIGHSDGLRVGDFVVAIGNPFNLGQTVTSGIVSALGRSGLGIEGLEDFIQTDASINPGNSGGALVDLHGDLVGVNTAIIAPGGGNIGIGFAIPADLAVGIMRQLIDTGEVRRSTLGVTTQDLTPDLAEAFGLKDAAGVLVTAVEADGAAAKAGLQSGDVIVTVDGKPVRRSNELRNKVGLAPLGTAIRLGYLRDGRQSTATATLVAAPTAKAQPERSGADLGRWLDGAKLRDSTPDDGGPGVVVTAVSDGSAAWRAHLRDGDVIVAANKIAVKSLKELQAALKSGANQLLLQVRRGNLQLFLVLH